MTSEDIIAEQADGGWRPTPRMLALWQASAATQGLQPALLIAGPDRIATAPFLGLTHKALGKTAPVVLPLIETTGKPTGDALNWWRSLT